MGGVFPAIVDFLAKTGLTDPCTLRSVGHVLFRYRSLLMLFVSIWLRCACEYLYFCGIGFLQLRSIKFVPLLYLFRWDPVPI